MTLDQMKEKLQSELKPSRFKHSCGVEETAVFLANRFGVDELQARVAGLLHDCARTFANEDMQSEADKRGISYGAVEHRMSLLLHAPLGACLAIERYGVHDELVLQAIARHTVGGTMMTRLDKIVYFADMIEPGRDYPGVDELRELSRVAELDDMLYEGLSQSISFVTAKRHMIHPATVLARNELLLKAEVNSRSF